MKKLRLIITALIAAICMTGCDVQIFEEKEEGLVFKEYSESEIGYNTWYIKNGTRFSTTYMPTHNFSGTAKTLNRTRMFFFYGDEYMIPTHYQGELMAYKSMSANVNSMILERFEDIGYTFGITGGRILQDGYYHFDSSRNIVAGTYAQRLFENVPSTEIRIISIDGNPVSDYVDNGSGSFVGLSKDSKYIIDFYAGTQEYRQYMYADIHALKAMEIFVYGKETISDTSHGYRAFDTPEDLKSGYYLVNGVGLMKYMACDKGDEDSIETLNEPYYSSEAEMLHSYTRQYNVNVPVAVTNLVITLSYGDIQDAEDFGEEPQCFCESPSGELYEMEVDKSTQTMTISFEVAKAGDWNLNILPKSLNVMEVLATSDSLYEEATCYTDTIHIEEDMQYQMFYSYIIGDLERQVYGSIISPYNVTYSMTDDCFKDEDGTHRYLYYRFPYLKAGDYKVNIYYYSYDNAVDGLKLLDYSTVTEELTVRDIQEETDDPEENTDEDNGETKE